MEYEKWGSRLFAGLASRPDADEKITSPTEMVTINRFSYDLLGILDFLGYGDAARMDAQIDIIETHNTAWMFLNRLLAEKSKSDQLADDMDEKIRNMMLLIMVTENTLPSSLQYAHTDFIAVDPDIDHFEPEARIECALKALDTICLAVEATTADQEPLSRYYRAVKFLRQARTKSQKYPQV